MKISHFPFVVLAILTLVFYVGCQDVDHLVITLDDEVSPGHYRGDACAQVNGVAECQEIDLYLPESALDTSTSSEPTEPVPDEPVAASEPQANPSPALVFVTPSGTKYHWICWRWERSNVSDHIPLQQAIDGGYTPCSLCQRKQEDN